MSDDIVTAFADLSDTYPGSKQTRRAVAGPAPQPVDGEAWDSQPRMIEVDGQPVEFFYIGALSTALRRSPVTLRKWMTAGILPKARYLSQGTTTRGDRRLWTRAQIEGLMRIAQEERIDTVPVRRTQFTSRSRELFRVLKERGE